MDTLFPIATQTGLEPATSAVTGRRANFSSSPGLAIQAVAGIFTFVWIVGICNSINFFDNVDGGAAGTMANSSLGIFYLPFQNRQFFIAALSSFTAGATIGVLLWNKDPARIYIGDPGALFLGVLIATLTIHLQPATDSLLKSLATPILLLAVPILDTTTVVISRNKRGVSPV